MECVCNAVLNVTGYNIKILSCTKMLLWRIDVASKNKTYLGLNAKCPIFLSDFN